MKFLFINILFCFCISVFSQDFIDIEELNRTNAKDIVENHLKDEVNGKDYLLFSIADEVYLIIIKNEKNFQEYFIKNDSLLYEKKIKNKILYEAFCPDNYIGKGSAYYDTSKITLGNGNNTYFYLMTKDGNKHGETFSVTMIAPTPIDSDIYYYLLDRLLVLNLETKKLK